MNSKIKLCIGVILITMLLYLSGSIYLVSFYYSEGVIISFIATLLIYVALKYFNKESLFVYQKSIICLLLAIISSFLISMVFNGIDDLYIALMLQILICVMVSELISYEKFINIFIFVVVVLSIISLCCFVLLQANPDIALLFNKTDAIKSVEYYNAYLYVFQGFTTPEGFIPTTRNNGIFWEPGAYQAFLNLALFFWMQKNNISMRNIYVPVILIITILTTRSSIGLAIMGVICFYFLLKTILLKSNASLKEVVKKNYIIFLIIAIIVVICSYLLLTHTTEKYYGLNSDYNNIFSVINYRLSLDKIHYLFQSSTNIFGLSAYVVDTSIGNIWNSIIYTLLAHGVMFTTILFIGYIVFSRYFKKDFLLCLLIIILCCSTQSLFLKPIFLLFVVYGFKKNDWGYINMSIRNQKMKGKYE